MNSLWGGVEQPSQWTPGGGVSTPPNGGSSEMHDWGCVHKITGVHGPPQGGCTKHPGARNEHFFGLLTLDYESKYNLNSSLQKSTINFQRKIYT